jgi:uncharacterized protein (DUF924 family)
MNDTIEKILEYWFGTFPNAYSSDPTRVDMWFRDGSSYDQEIFITFGSVYHRAINGELDHWQEMPRGRLALIILLDQFSRHIHREQAEAFAQDEKAQQLCIDGIAAGDDLALHNIERSFFYLPLEHAEDLDRQNLSVEAFTRLVEDVPEAHRKSFEMSLEWARKHHYVIELFGRFPELNDILGRESTQEELEFLENSEYSFL